MMQARSTLSSVSRTLWSVISTPMSRFFSSRTSSRMSEIEMGSMPANGSSSSMIDGSAASARAISQRRPSPPDSALAGRGGNRDAPPPAARQRHGGRVAQMGDVELAEQLFEPLAPHRLVGLGDLE